MRVLAITTDDISLGAGGSVHLMETLRRFKERGLKVTLLAPKPKSEEIMYEIDTYFINFKGEKIFKHLRFNLTLFNTLCRMFKNGKVDLIYVRQMSYSPIPVFLAKLFRVHSLLEINGVPFDELNTPGLEGKVRLLIIWVSGFIDLLLSKITTVTMQCTIGRLRYYYPMLSPNFHIVPCDAANPDIFYPQNQSLCRRELGLPDCPIGGYVGTLYLWHGVDQIIDALPEILKLIPNFKFLVVGDGDQMNKIKELAYSLNVDSCIIYAGSVPYGEIAKYINSMDVAFAFYRQIGKRPVNIPMKLYEYMACGIPVVASNVKGYGSIVKHEGVGYEVDSNNLEKIAKTVSVILKSPEKSKLMAKAGRLAVLNKFNWNNRIDYLVEKIKEKLGWSQLV